MNLKTIIRKYNSARRLFKENPDTPKIEIIVKHLKQKYYPSQRSKQLISEIPDIFNYRSVLYIGACQERIEFGDDFIKKKYRFDVIEIFEPNVEFLRNNKKINKVIHGDVRNIDSIVEEKYDVIFWWHGPEHIYKEELDATLTKLKDIAAKLVVCGCPWGEYKQEAIGGNFWQNHLSALYPEDFKRNGFQTSTLGIKDLGGSNLLAWYRQEIKKS